MVRKHGCSPRPRPPPEVASRRCACPACLVARHSPYPTRAPADTGTPQLELPAGVTLEQMMQRVERQLVESTLRRCHYHKDKAAKELGLGRSTLFKKLKEWGLGPEED